MKGDFCPSNFPYYKFLKYWLFAGKCRDRLRRERSKSRLCPINSDEHDAKHGVRSVREQPMATERKR